MATVELVVFHITEMVTTLTSVNNNICVGSHNYQEQMNQLKQGEYTHNNNADVTALVSEHIQGSKRKHDEPEEAPKPIRPTKSFKSPRSQPAPKKKGRPPKGVNRIKSKKQNAWTSRLRAKTTSD
jgi:hypothetical protein